MKSESMTHDEFFQSLKAGRVSGLYLFEGEEEHIKRSALQQLEKVLPLGAFPDMNQTVLKDPDANQLIAAAETLPFMADRRMVVVSESGMLAGKARDYDEAASAERLKTYLPELPDTTALVFYVRGAADKRKKLYQTIKKCGCVVSFDRLDSKQLQSYIARAMKKAGLSITAEACDQLVYSVGDDLTTVLSEIEKLIAYCDGRSEVTGADIRAVCTARTEYRIFELAQTVLQGRSKQAFAMLRAMLVDGEQPLMLLALLSRQCRQVYDAKLYLDQGMQQAAIAGRLGIPPFAVRQLVPLTRLYSPEALADMTRYCAQVEFEVKAGLLTEEGAMEQAMLHILALKGNAA